MQAWDDAADLADRKWEKVFEDLIPAAQRHIACELKLSDPRTIAFGANTHELVQRVFSAKYELSPLDVLTTDGEFHSFRRQVTRWEEQGVVRCRVVPCEPFETFTERYISAVAEKSPDIAFVSHVMYQSGLRFGGIDALASFARSDGTWVIVDGYHAFMAFPVDLSGVCNRVFYIAGGYKYAMAGEGAAFLHSPPGYGERPVDTGWFAEFANVEAQDKAVSYSSDGMRFMGATFDPSGLYRFNAVRDMLTAEGLDTYTVCERSEALRNKLEIAISTGHAGILSDASILRPNQIGPQPRFIALRTKHASGLKSAMLARGIVADARGAVLRIGIGLYHDESDVDALCNKLTSMTQH
jgi:selenocysteine lyase/cysteine desulfurase